MLSPTNNPYDLKQKLAFIMSKSGTDQLRKIKWEEIRKHKAVTDLWIVVEGKVYDVTRFTEEHPGGSRILLDVAGQDGTETFDMIGHSKYAIIKMQEYLVGEVDGKP